MRAPRRSGPPASGQLRLLYVAPERFASDQFVELLRDVPIARFVIDEAHCVSEWGHDFRPDYRRLRDAAAACRRGDGRPGRPPIAAFTATATPEVRDDIVDLLGLARPHVIVAGFDRPNIHLRVLPVAGENEKHRLLPAARRRPPGAGVCVHAQEGRSRGRHPAGGRRRGRRVPRRAWPTTSVRACRRRSRRARCVSSARRTPSAWASTGPTSTP